MLSRENKSARDAMASARWWSERLGVTHSPIAYRDYGSVLTFKDPDGIQFEMFDREGHPESRATTTSS